MLGHQEALGSWHPEDALPLDHLGDGLWSRTIAINEPGISYKYIIKDEHSGHSVKEWGPNRKVDLSNLSTDKLLLRDAWQTAGHPENPLHSSCFVDNIFKRNTQGFAHHQTEDANYLLQILAPNVGPGYSLCVCGAHDTLGSWSPEKAVVMNDSQFPLWKTNLSLEAGDAGVDFKFGLYSHAEQKLVQWEEGNNRQIDRRQDDVFTIQSETNYRQSGHYWRGAGTAIPVFSLRSSQSWGVGEFLDLIPLIDWSEKTQLRLIQILPVNDTTASHNWRDSYPYAAISVFALHPLYLHLPAMGRLQDAALMQSFEERAAALNAKAALDYEAVMLLKSEYFKLLYEQEKQQLFRDQAFRQFFAENKNWLAPYAAFSCLRDRHATANFDMWPSHSQYHLPEIKEFVSPNGPNFDEVAVHYFVQYHLHRQLKAVAEHAKAKHIALKGDVPIGIYRHSVDAWMEPRFFHLNQQAGAPPDAFSEEGQNWGFPTYNWEEMAKDNYVWWRLRLQHMSQYFDVYRLDHILGFFRIWEIPSESIEGTMGVFNPAIPLYLYEIDGNGMRFDFARLCQPYIREHVLDEIFGEKKDYVKEHFLIENEEGQYAMRSDFTTQRQVKDHFDREIHENPADKEPLSHMANGLLTLIGNVVFFENKSQSNTGYRAYHPRFALHNTTSYRNLEPATRQAIDRLYNHYFFERQEHLWRDKALTKLPAVMHTNTMLACGEDLGMVPSSVPDVLNHLGILSTVVPRMPKHSDQAFSHPMNAPYLSVISSATHDMSTLRGWWMEEPERAKEYYHQVMGQTGSMPEELTAELVEKVLHQIVQSPAMWAIIPLQDLLAMDADLRHSDARAEQINFPGSADHLWNYRMHLEIEDLHTATKLNTALSQLLEDAGRAVL